MRLRLLALVILAASSLSLQASTIYSTSFEQPTYSPGNVTGQGDFAANLGSVDSSSVGQVVTGIANSGSQSVAFNATGTVGQNLDTLHPASPFFTATPGNETVNVQMSAMFNAADPNSAFDILSLSSSDNFTFISQLLYLNGQVLFGGNSLSAAPDTWNIYAMNLDFATMTTTAYMNGNYIGSEAFYLPAQDLAYIEFGINAKNPNGAATATGYFDDLSVNTSQVPEPSSLVLLGTGIVGLAGIARRKFVS